MMINNLNFFQDMKAIKRLKASKRRITYLLFFFLSNVLIGQNDAVEMADVMRSNGKIYVVVGIMTIIFVGIVIYMFIMESRIRKLKK